MTDIVLQQDSELPPANMPEMQRPLDIVLKCEEDILDRDLEVIQRDFPDGKGKLEVLHNSQLKKSLMSGSFEHHVSTGGTTRYAGTFADPDEVGLDGSDTQKKTEAYGQGVRVMPDGSTYSGQWNNGLPDGRGEWRAPEPSCESYIGEWKVKDPKGHKIAYKHGFGIQKFANGDTYEGDYKDGKFHDRGKYTYANGDVFMGIYDSGIKVNGSFYFTNGEVSIRKYENGKLVSCQDFDANKKVYRPTISHSQVHAPERNAYGSKAGIGMISPRGVRVE
jgi:hypothetical protein